MTTTKFTQKYLQKLLHLNESEWEIALDLEDVNHLIECATSIAIQETNGNTIQEAVNALSPEELECDNAQKLLFVVLCNKSYQPIMAEIAKLNDFISSNFKSDDIRWGFASDYKSEHNATIIAVTAR